MIKTILYFRILMFIMMVTTYLPLIYNRLPDYVGSHHFWTILWGVSLLFLKPKVFIQKLMLLVLMYGLFLFIMIRFFWTDMNEWNVKALWVEFYQIAVGCSIITYFHVSKDYLSLAKLTRWVLIFIAITSVLTIFFYTQIVETTERLGWEEWNEGSKKYGYATYGMAIVLMSVMGVLIYLFKNKILNFKYLWLFFLFIVAIALIRIQLFTNIMLAAFLVILSMVSAKNRKTTFVIISIIGLIIILIPQAFYINILYKLSVVFADFKEISFKLKETAIYLEFGEYVDRNAIAGRAERYTWLLRTFPEHPFMGCFYMQKSPTYNEACVHLHWMNKLVVTGILGIVFFVPIFIQFLKQQLRIIKGNYQFYFILSIISILLYGVFKTIAGREAWYMFFVIIPGMYYLPLLNKKNNLNENEEGIIHH